MTLKHVPIDTWMVVDVGFNRWNVVSTHASQNDAERERDTRNEGAWPDGDTPHAWHLGPSHKVRGDHAGKDPDRSTTCRWSDPFLICRAASRTRSKPFVTIRGR